MARDIIRDALKPSPSFWSRLTSNPMLNLIVGFILTAAIGAAITNYYTEHQKLLEFSLADRQNANEQRRVFLNKLNEKRVEKIAEIVEKLWLHAAKVDETLEHLAEVVSASPRKRPDLDKLREIFEAEIAQEKTLDAELREMLSKNRFWIGDRTYTQIDHFRVEASKNFLEEQIMWTDIQDRRSRLHELLTEIRKEIWRKADPSSQSCTSSME